MSARKLSCAVLGASGFIGTNLCRRLLSRGHRIRAFGRNGRFHDGLLGVEWYQGDFSAPDSVATAIENCDIVFHLVHSAMPQAANLAMTTDVRRNIIPSITLLDLCCKLRVKRLIFASSGGTVYGAPDEIPTPETARTDPICAYGISKLAIEKYLALYEYLHGLDFRILRIANPFGSFQTTRKGQGFIAAAVSRALQGRPIEVWGDGSIVRDFVYIDDVIDAFEAAMRDTSDVRVFNIGSGEGRSLNQVLAALEELLDAELRVERAAGRPIDVPVSTLAIDRAMGVLDWRPKTAFEYGLRLTIDWIAANQHHLNPLSR